MQMSAEVFSNAIKRSCTTGVARLVLFSLCDQANERGYAFVSPDSICEWANADADAVGDAVAQLCDSGEAILFDETGPGDSLVFRAVIGVNLAPGEAADDLPDFPHGAV